MSFSPRSSFAVAAGRLASVASQISGKGRGQTIAGLTMNRLDPQLMSRLSAGKNIALVSATNGKSTTTRFLAEALRSLGQPVAHNSTGANMESGVTKALADTRKAQYAALEVDEAHLPFILGQTRANVLVLMNLTRDQLDRGSEVKMLATRWQDMIDRIEHPCTIIANADDPNVVWAVGDDMNVVWVGAGQWWNDDSDMCPQCAAPLKRAGGGVESTWLCPHCGLARPDTSASWQVIENNSDKAAYAIRTPDSTVHIPHLALPGRVNIGNAAMAAAAAGVYGIAASTAIEACGRVADIDGRYLTAEYSGHKVRLLLGKNPASWTELIDIVHRAASPLVIAINSRGADGRDPSWLWDVPFERLAGMSAWATGERCYDLAVRLDTAGLDVVGVQTDPLVAAGLAATASDEGQIDIVANYTAFQDARARVLAIRPSRSRHPVDGSFPGHPVDGSFPRHPAFPEGKSQDPKNGARP